MAQAPLKVCPGCRRKFTREKLCEACAATPRPRTTPTDPFYASTAWRNLRERFIRENPLCKPCEDAGRVTPAFIADHILERKDRPDLELDESNLQPMCLSCHSRKTRLEAAKRRRNLG